MSADPSPSQLPPEWVEAIRGELGVSVAENGGELPADMTLHIARALAPLLAERDAEHSHELLQENQRFEGAIAHWQQTEAEARRLREALGWYGDERNYGPDNDPGEAIGGGTDPETGAFEIDEWEVDRGRRARAALSASPDPDLTPAQRVSKAAGNALARIEAGVYGPVSVPEQEEGRADEALFCPDGHLVVPARLSVAEGLFYCDGCRKGPKAYYSRGDLAAAPSSSSAGDEAREALAELKAAVEHFDAARPALEGDLAAVLKVARRLASLPSPSPLPEAGDGRRARFDRLVAAIEAIELHGRDDRFPCHAICDADCIEVMRETAAAARRAVTEPLSGVEQTKETTRDA